MTSSLAVPGCQCDPPAFWANYGGCNSGYSQEVRTIRRVCTSRVDPPPQRVKATPPNTTLAASPDPHAWHCTAVTAVPQPQQTDPGCATSWIQDSFAHLPHIASHRPCPPKASRLPRQASARSARFDLYRRHLHLPILERDSLTTNISKILQKF